MNGQISLNSNRSTVTGAAWILCAIAAAIFLSLAMVKSSKPVALPPPASLQAEPLDERAVGVWKPSEDGLDYPDP